jgi:hypothetical protein
VCKQNFQKLAPRRNRLAETLVCQKEQKKITQEQDKANFSKGIKSKIFYKVQGC